MDRRSFFKAAIAAPVVAKEAIAHAQAKLAMPISPSLLAKGCEHVAIAEPIEVPRNLDSDEVERYRRELEMKLLELDGICAKELGLDQEK